MSLARVTEPEPTVSVVAETLLGATESGGGWLLRITKLAGVSLTVLSQVPKVRQVRGKVEC